MSCIDAARMAGAYPFVMLVVAAAQHLGVDGWVSDFSIV